MCSPVRVSRFNMQSAGSALSLQRSLWAKGRCLSQASSLTSRNGTIPRACDLRLATQELFSGVPTTSRYRALDRPIHCLRRVTGRYSHSGILGTKSANLKVRPFHTALRPHPLVNRTRSVSLLTLPFQTRTTPPPAKISILDVSVTHPPIPNGVAPTLSLSYSSLGTPFCSLSQRSKNHPHPAPNLLQPAASAAGRCGKNQTPCTRNVIGRHIDTHVFTGSARPLTKKVGASIFVFCTCAAKS